MPLILAKSPDENILFTPIAKNQLNEAVLLCKLTDPRFRQLRKNAEAIIQFENLLKESFKDGLTIIAIDKATNVIVGVAFNKLLTYQSAITLKNNQNYIQHLLIEPETLLHLLDKERASSFLQTVCMGVMQSFRSEYIRKELLNSTRKLAKKLQNNQIDLNSNNVINLQLIPSGIIYFNKKYGVTELIKLQK